MHSTRNSGPLWGLATSAVLGLSLGASLAGPAAATIIFDDDANADYATHQVPGATGADFGYGGTITVAAPTPITNFTLGTYQQNGGDLKFLIYDENTRSFLYQSAPVTYGTAYFDPVESPALSLTLQPGITYDLGAISDADTYYAYDYVHGTDTATTTENGITGPPRNLLFQDYASPGVRASGTGSQATPGAAAIGLQIYNGQASAAPEPSEGGVLALLAAGLGGPLLRAGRRRRSA